MPQGDVFIAEACALQQYSHAIWVKTFTTNAVNDPSHHMSAESRPSEPYINTCTHVCLLSCVGGSWTLIKAAEDSCQPSAVVLIDVVPRDCYMFWHIQYIDAQWHGVVLEPDFFATVIINMLTGFDCGWHLHFLRQKKKKKRKNKWQFKSRLPFVSKTLLHVCCSGVFNVQWLKQELYKKSFPTHFLAVQLFGTTAARLLLPYTLLIKSSVFSCRTFF